jgi:hypothetical protein
MSSDNESGQATRPTITVPDMCQRHQRLLLDQIGIGPDGPWRSAIVASQVTLFQGATAHPSTSARLGGDITRIGELGCLACDRPDVFGQVVQAWRAGGMGAVKALGEQLVADPPWDLSPDAGEVGP